MRFLCIFVPSVLAAKQELKGKEDVFEEIVVYSKYLVYINFIMLLFLFMINKGAIHFEEMCTVRYYLLYLFGSFVLAQILPKMIIYCRENFNIKIKRNTK